MPNKAAVERALAAIRKRPANYDYFFQKLESPEWLEPLFDAGMFQNPPPAERSGELIGFPAWPEANYLARVACLAPEAVLKIITRLPETDNVRVHDEVISIALELPPALAARVANREALWIANQPSLYFLPERIGQLVVHLAAGNEMSASLGLAARLFEIVPRNRGDASFVRRDLNTKMRTWEYGDLLRRIEPILIGCLKDRAFAFLVELLSNAILSTSGEETTKDSWVWRPAIEDHGQNISDRPLDDLVVAVRDGAANMILGGFVSPDAVVSSLIDRGGIFVRIGLHLLSEFGGQTPNQVAAKIGDRHLFDLLDCRHEYDRLSELRFGAIPIDVQNTVLDWIDAGPGNDRIDRWRQNGSDESEVVRRLQHWRRDRLYPIRTALTGAWAERYSALIAAVGEADHPGFVAYQRSFVGPTSPKTSAELQSMTTAEIVQFLQTWKPKDEWMEASEDGLGRQLEQAVIAEPDRFARDSERFTHLDPTYVRSIFGGFFGALRSEKSFEWAPVLTMSTWVLNQEREIAGRVNSSRRDRDPDWGWTRKQIADLLVGALEHRINGLPFEFRADVWNLLENLSDDPDPDAAFDASSSMDPISQSLNTVRGQTMHAVMYYALWVRRQATGSTEVTAAPGGLPAEVRELLEKKLDPVREPSRAVRSVFGRWFSVLLTVDPAWFASHVDKIFPTDAAHADLRMAAWEPFLASTRPDAGILALMRKHYVWAIERLAAPTAQETRFQFVQPDQSLAEHLMILYWRGDDPSSEGATLLERFSASAPIKIWEHALTFVGRSFHGISDEPLPAAVKQRLTDLFEQRLNDVSAGKNGGGNQFAGFGWWFSAHQLDLGWRITQLRKVLSVLPNLQGDFLVIEELERHVEGHPIEVLECLDLVLRGDNPSWTVLGSRARFEKILSIALRSSETSVVHAAKNLVHQLGAIGHSEFRQLLRSATP